MPSPRCSRSAARGLRGLCRLLPLPCANSTMPPSLRERGQVAAERYLTDGDPHGCLTHGMRPAHGAAPAEAVWIALSIALLASVPG